MDRIDGEYMRQLAQEAREKRDAEIDIAGPLFDEMQHMIIEDKIASETMLPRSDVSTIVDIIEHYAGRDKEVKVRDIIKGALEDHI